MGGVFGKITILALGNQMRNSDSAETGVRIRTDFTVVCIQQQQLSKEQTHFILQTKVAKFSDDRTSLPCLNTMNSRKSRNFTSIRCLAHW
jgi:hypothetical protein